MANKKINATATLFLETKDAENDAKQFVGNLKKKLSEIETAADKMTVFKDLVAYIAQADRALAALRADNKDAFNSMFDGLDANLKQQIEGLFGVNGAQLGQVDVLREKLNTLTLKSSIKEIRTFAKEINTLFTSIGVSAPFDNINEQFSGRTNTGHIQALATSLASFATVWKDLNVNIAKGLGVGGGSVSGGAFGGLNKEAQEEIDRLKKQKLELQETIDAINGQDIKINVTVENDAEELEKLIEAYREIQKQTTSNDFNSMSFDEQNKLLAERVRLATLLKKTGDHIIENGGSDAAFDMATSGDGMRAIENAEKFLDDFHSGMQHKANQIKETFADLIASIDVQINQLSIDSLNLEPTKQSVLSAIELMKEANRIMGEISYDSPNNDLLDAQLDTLIEKIKQLATTEEQVIRLDELLGDYRDAPEDALEELCNILEIHIPKSAEKAKESIDGIAGGNNQPSKQNISILAKQLQEIYNLGRQIGDNEIGFAVDIDGAAYFVQSADHMVKVADEASVAVRALNENLTILGHTHPNGGGLFSAGDYRSAISQKRSGMNMPVVAVGSNAASVLNLDGVNEEVLGQIEHVLDRFKNSDDAVGPSVIKELQNILSTNGFTDALQVVDISNGMDDLSEALLKLSLNAKEVQTPLQKLQSLIQYYSSNQLGADGISRFANEWKAFESGAKSAAEVFDSVMYKLDATDLDGNYFRTSEKEYENLSTSLNMIKPSADTAINSLSEAENKLKSFFEFADKMQHENLYGSAENNVDIGRYIERLETAKAELEELGAQGLITAEDLEKVNLAFTEATVHLEAETSHYDSYYSGPSYDYYDEYKEQQDRAEIAEGENTRLQRQLETMRQLSELDKQIGLTHDNNVDQLDSLIEQRKTLLDEAESANSLNEQDLQTQRAITQEYEERSKFIHDGYDKAFHDFYDELNSLRYKDIGEMGIEDIDGYIDRLSALYAKLQEANNNYLLGDDLYGNVQEFYTDAISSLNNAKARMTPKEDQEAENNLARAHATIKRLREENNSLREEVAGLQDQIRPESDDDELSDIQKENGALQDKLELLKEIADTYGVHITQAARNRYEELSDKEMESGLTSREENRMSELSDTISEADSNLAELEETYDRIILKLSNGKKVEILPDDAGLRKLYKISNEYYDGEYNGFEIEDVEFVRQEQFLRTKIESYEELCGVVERYNQLAMKGSDRTSKESLELSAIQERFHATKGTRTPDEAIDDSIVWSRMLGPLGDVSTDNVAKYLGIEIPRAAQQAESAIVDTAKSVELIEDVSGQFKLFDEAVEDAQKAEVAVENLNNEIKETSALDGQIGIDDYLASKHVDNINQDIKKATDVPMSNEIAQLEELQQKLLEVKTTIDAKTQAFEEEYVTVDGVVDAEIASLQSLIAQLQEVVTQINLINDGFNNINTNAPKVELKSAPVEQSGATTENPYYLTDSRGNRKLMYRGVNGAMSGLVSNRYHGGTFFTDLASLAKRYAGIDGKVETANISMKNPLEIDVNGHQWNDIEYLGNGADEASKKIRQCRKELDELSEWALQNIDIKVNLLTDKGFDEFEQEINNMISNDWSGNDQLSKIQMDKFNGYLEKARTTRQEYLDISNADSNVYGLHDTNRFVELAKNAGYDGVVFRNIKDGTNEISNIVVTLQENQIHFIETLKTNFESLLTDFIGHFGKIEDFMSHYNQFKTDHSLFPEMDDEGRALFGEQLDKYEELQMMGEPEIINEFLNKNKILGAYDKRVPGGLDGLFSMEDAESRIDAIVSFYLNAIYELEKIQEAFNTKATSVEQYQREQSGNLTAYDKISTIESGYNDKKLNDKESYKYADAVVEDLHAKKNQAIAAVDAFKELFASLDMGTASPEQLKQVVDSFVNAIKLIDDAQSMATGIVENSIGAPDVAAMRDFHELGPIRDSLTADYLDILESEAKQIEQIEIDAQKAQEQRLKAEQESANIVSQKTHVETVPDTNVQEEVNQLNQLKAVLGEVKNAIATKTKAFVDEGNVVGQTVGKEISALMKLSETVDGIVPRVNSLVDGLKGLKYHGVDIKDQGASKTRSDDGQTTSGTKDAPPQDSFTKKLYNQKNAFNEYRDSLKDVDYLTDSLRTELDSLGVSLQRVSDQPGLDTWIKSFDALQNSVKDVQSEFAQMNNSKINLYQKELNSAFNKLTLPQKEGLFEEYTKAIILLNQQKQAVKDGHAVELAGIKQITAALQEKIDAQIQANKAAKDAEKTQKKNANFGSTASINATAKYNSLSQIAGSDQFANSSEVANALSLYEQHYKRLIKMRDEIRAKDIVDDSDREAFKAATTECNNYAKALEKIIQNSRKLSGNRVNKDPYMLGSDFADDKEGRIAALTDFAKKIYDVDLAATDFKDNWNKAVFAVDNGDGTFTQMTATFTDARNEIVALAGDTKKVQGALANFWDELKGKFKSIGAYLVASFSFHEVWQVIRQGVNYVREIDSALTELKKVTNETDASYAQFLQDMSKTGSVIGATVADLTTMASEWARLGYSMEEAGKLAESTAVLLNVSEFQDATVASEALISTMQAFQYTADESGHVVDILNEIGNSYAVSSDGIATALQDSASALMEGGNNLEQAVALVAAANRVVQDPNSVGSALRTISLRLRGTSVEILEEIGEETDGVVESTSKLQEKIKALSGIDILTDAGEYKDTYTILKEIGNVWEDMSDIDQAALLELMAGKNRANTLSAILSNMTDLEGAYNDALKAEGSAMRENEAYLDSIQGRIDLFNNSVQTMWMNFIDSEVVKFVVDIGTGLIKLADNVGILKIALAGLLTYFNASSKYQLDFSSMFGLVDTKNIADQVNEFTSILSTIKNVELTIDPNINVAEILDGMSVAAKNGQQSLIDYTAALGPGTDAIKAYAASVQDGNYSLAGFQQFITQHNAGLKSSGVAAKAAAVGHQLLNAALSMGIALIASFAIDAIVKGLDALIVTNDELIQQADELQNAYSSQSKTIQDNISTLHGLKEEFDELSRGVDDYGNNISLATEDYERYQSIIENIVGISPSLIDGYDAEGNAIANKNGLLEESIRLMQEEQRLNAQKLVSDDSLETIGGSIQAELDGYKKENPLPYGSAKSNFMSEFASGISDDNDYDVFKALSPDGYLWGDYSGAGADSIYAQNFASDFYDAIVADLRSEESKLSSYFTDEQRENMLEYAREYEKNVQVYNSDVEAINKEFNSTLQIVPLSETSYYTLSDEMKGYLTQYINGLDVTADNLLEKKQDIIDLTNFIANNSDVQSALSTGFKLNLGQDKDGNTLSFKEYKSEIENFIQEINNADYTDEQKNTIFDLIGLNTESKEFDNEIKNAVVHAQNLLKDEFDSNIDNLSISDILITTRITEDPNSLTFEDLRQKIQEIKDINGIDIVGAKTYSVLIEEIESYNDILSQTSEIVSDNTEVTQEYKDALIALGVSEDDLNDCFYDNNKLVVKDSKALNNLVKSAKKNTAQNIKLAKSQARLEYYELYKEMQQLTNGTKVTDAATLRYINSLYEQMSAVQRTIAKYSLLEAELLGTANAYQELADAQAADEAMDYGSKAEELVNVLAEAFNTAQLGTEAARVAFKGIIPDDVIDKTKTLDDQMQQAYEYFTKGPVSQLFTIEFDEEGVIQSVEMTKENVQAFTESLIGAGEDSVFQGTWDEFTLNPAIKNIEDFANAIGSTKEVAFAYLTELEKYDIGNIFGGGDSLLDQLMGDNLDYQLQKAIQTAAEVEKKLAEGTLEASSKEYQDAQKQLEELEEKTIEDATAWSKKQQAIEEQKDLLKEYQKEYEKAVEEQDTSKIEEFEGKIKDTSKEIDTIIDDLRELDEPTEFVLEVAMSEAKENIAEFKEDIDELVKSGDEKAIKINSFIEKIDTTGLENLESLGFVNGPDGVWRGTANIEGWSSLDPASKQKVLEYINMIEKEHQIDVLMGEGAVSVEDQLNTIAEILEDIAKILDPTYTLTVDTADAEEKTTSFKSMWDSLGDKTITLFQNVVKTVTSFFTRTPKDDDSVSVKDDGGVGVNGTAHMSGTANAHGSWGAAKTETSLVGELGPEILVRGNRWTTVGDNGAEFTQVKKGDIIFNHKQTEQLLKNGYVTGRGKLQGGHAFASGTAYAGINTWDDAYKKVHEDYSNTEPLSDAADSLSSAADDISDSADEFKETFDWIEVRLEELDETLGYLNATLENTTYYNEKNSIIDSIIGTNEIKMSNLKAGIEEYARYASKLLAEIPAEYQEAVQNGAIAITDFAGEADEATLEAINNYREWAQKVADLRQQLEEVKTELKELAIQKIDNARESGDVRATVEDSQTEKLQNAVDLIEEKGEIADAAYYEAMMENSNKKIEYLTKSRNAMQKELDEAVESGEITRGSNEWYELVNQMYEVDAAIDEATLELEQFQNAINDIEWENFDQLINRIDYLKDETQNLIDLMDSDDLFTKQTGKDYWGNEDVTWTDEGLATLGLYAQQMEIAEYEARQYGEAIDKLTADYEAGLYSENEYYEKLNELKSAQYDSIEAYEDTKKAIVDLNKARIDHVKQGIEKEIDAYSELIEKKKEALDSEKDLYDFQKSVSEKQKNIADIQRQLDALAYDTSTSAMAKKAQLQAELAEANADLEETYYDRSISNQQEALDKELEDFQEAKEKEIEELELYLENVEQVVADSLMTVQTNATTVYDTLNAKADEYGLNVSDAITAPWEDGALAVSGYQETFDTAASSTMDQLDAMKNKWQEVIDKMQEASDINVEVINKENANYAKATVKSEPAKTLNSAPPSNAKATPSVGSTVTVKKSATNFSANSKNAKMASFVPGGSYTVYEVSGGQVLIGRNGVYTGWVKQTDLEGYAKGTKSASKDQLAILDELGEELQLVPGANGRLEYIKKGTSIIPAKMTERLMDLVMDPQEMLDRNRPQIGVHPEVHNTEIKLDITYGDMVSIGEFHGDNLADLEKMVAKQFEKHTKDLNNAIRKYVR